MTATAYYGSFAHASDSVGINNWSREFVLGQTGYAKILRITADLEVKILGSMLNIFAFLETMKAAYSVSGQSFAIYDDACGTPIWTLDSNSAIGGVTVLKPVAHQAVKGSEGVTYLKCQIVLQADYLQPLGQNQFLSFKETVSFKGRGQALKVWRQPARGKAFAQPVTTTSRYFATQSGSLSTTTPFPGPMAPLWPELPAGAEDDATIDTPGSDTVRVEAVEYFKQWL